MKTLLVLAVLSGTPDAGVPCFDNLCGMDSYCSCHPTGDKGQTRCYANTYQCELDRDCCNRFVCKGSPRIGDKCTDVVVAAIHAARADAGHADAGTP